MSDLRQITRLQFLDIARQQVVRGTLILIPQLSFLGTFDMITIGGTVIAFLFSFKGSGSYQESLRVELKNSRKKYDQSQSLSEICMSDILSITSDQANKYRQLYSCPISYQLMKDPVLANCSQCTMKKNYERVIIEEHIDNYHNCPFCKQSLQKSHLITNDALRESIKLFKQQIHKKMIKYQQKRIQNEGLQ